MNLDCFSVVEENNALFIVLPPGRIVGALRQDDDAWHLYDGPERRRITALRASDRHDAVLEAVEMCCANHSNNEEPTDER